MNTKTLKRYLKRFWQKIKPSVQVFGSFSWFMTKIAIVLILTGGIAGAGVGTGLLAGVLRDIPEFDPSKLERPFLPSYIYDVNGDLITEIHDEQNRIPITLDEVPEHVRDAFLAIEDTRFRDHHGFDLRAVARAFYTNIVHPDRPEGASTLTQQLVKQAFLTREKTWQRKLQELLIAIQVERQYSKDEIFEFYLNIATFYGNSAYGIEAAAQTYFDKTTSELTLAEGALLAGIPNYPTYYAPRQDDLEISIKRRNEVLRRMVTYGFISQEEADEAMEEEIVLAPLETASWPYPHYIDSVVHNHAVDILKDLGYSEADAEQALRRDGLHIYTALDPRIQDLVQGVIMNDDYYPPDSFVYPESHDHAGRRYPQGAAVVMDSKTGYVYGMVGGREYDSTNRINRAEFAANQPGSAIKPVTVYGPAFEWDLLSPGSVLDDAPTAWPDSSRASGYYAPENFARTFRGIVTVREAIVISDNIPALKAYEMLQRERGYRAPVEFATRLGIKGFTEDSPYMLSTAMGGSDYGTNVLEMAEAFSAFANRGIKTSPIFVTRIVDRDGNELFEATPDQEVVLSRETAFMITDILRDVVRRGTASPTRLRNLNVAAKTGTTDNAHDRWTVGYSPDYVFGVWMGNDSHRVTIDGQRVYVPGLVAGRAYTLLNHMFGDIARGVIGNNDTPFPGPPSTLVRATVCNKSGLLPSEHCPDSCRVTEWFKRGNVPTETCDMHIPVDICTLHGLRATEHCPEELVETRIFLNRDFVEPTDERWSGPRGRLPADYKQRPPDEYCYYHGPRYAFTVTWDNNRVALNWEWDSESEYAGFHIFRKAFNEEEYKRVTNKMLPITARSWNDSLNPVPGLGYEYRIMVIDIQEDEDSGETTTREMQRHETKQFRRPLLIDLGIQWSEEEEVITLNWDPPQTNADIAGYKVFRNDAPLTDELITETNFTDSDLTGGETYEYQVSVTYRIGGNSYESILSSKTDPFTVPGSATGSLTIKKVVNGNPDDMPTFTITVTGPEGQQMVALDGPDSTTLVIKPGQYTVTEQTDGLEDGWSVEENDIQVEVKANQTASVTITNNYGGTTSENHGNLWFALHSSLFQG